MPAVSRPQLGRDRRGGQRVGTWCAPCTPIGPVPARGPGRGDQVNQRPAEVVQPDVRGAEVGLRAQPERDDPGLRPAGHGPHPVIVGVQDRYPAAGRGQRREQFALGPGDLLEPPNSPVCACPTLSTAPTRGGAISHR